MNERVQSAASLAPQPEKSPAEVRDGETIQFVTFYFGEHLFDLPIDEVIKINRALEITPVPLVPDYVAGVVNLRGQILAAIHLANRISLVAENRQDILMRSINR